MESGGQDVRSRRKSKSSMTQHSPASVHLRASSLTTKNAVIKNTSIYSSQDSTPKFNFNTISKPLGGRNKGSNSPSILGDTFITHRQRPSMGGENSISQFE